MLLIGKVHLLGMDLPRCLARLQWTAGTDELSLMNCLPFCLGFHVLLHCDRKHTPLHKLEIALHWTLG